MLLTGALKRILSFQIFSLNIGNSQDFASILMIFCINILRSVKDCSVNKKRERKLRVLVFLVVSQEVLVVSQEVLGVSLEALVVSLEALVVFQELVEDFLEVLVDFRGLEYFLVVQVTLIYSTTVYSTHLPEYTFPWKEVIILL